MNGGAGYSYISHTYLGLFESKREIFVEMSSIIGSPVATNGRTSPYHTGCLVVKPANLSQVVVSPARQSVSIKMGVHDSSGEIKTESFAFNSKLFTTSDEFTTGAYSSMVQPLVKKTCAGENTTAVIGGPGSLDFSTYLLSSASSRGLLAQAANQMLNSIMVNGKREGTVTFSWYKLGCQGTNTIDDVLRSASEVSSQGGEKAAADLQLKELEKGRGVAVPGLWEVELSTSSDVDAVITHVQRISPGAKHGSGNAHSVIQLTVTSEHIRNSVSFGTTNTYADLKGVGKISFLVLGNLKRAGWIGPEWDKQPFCPWVDNVLTTIQWIESQELGIEKSGPPPPAPDCGTSMALKDVLRGRQASMLLLMLTPTEKQVSETRQWLLLAEALENTRTSYVSSGMASSPVPNNASRFSSPHPEAGTGAGVTSQSKTRPVPSSTTKPRPMTPSRFNGANVPHSLLPPGASSSSKAAVSAGLGSAIKEKIASSNGSAIKSPAAHHEFVEGGTGYVILSTAKDEIKALTEALRVKTEMLEEAQGAYEMLVQQLHEDGSTLKKKDRDRYRQVLAELKDYEIYKNVMESALTKMQKELEALLSDNQALKAKLSHKESDIKRREMSRDQYTKDLTNTRRSLTEALEAKGELEEKNKKLLKTGEEMRTNFNAMRNDRNEMKKELELQTSQVLALKEKVALMESRDRERCREEEKIRESHKAVMENLLSHQEENDLLKGALAELLEDSMRHDNNKKSDNAPKVSPTRRDSKPGEPQGILLKKAATRGYRGSVVFKTEEKQQKPSPPKSSSAASSLFSVSEESTMSAELNISGVGSSGNKGAKSAQMRKSSILG